MISGMGMNHNYRDGMQNESMSAVAVIGREWDETESTRVFSNNRRSAFFYASR